MDVFTSSEEGNKADISRRKSGSFKCCAQIDSKGRITVPARIRRKLGLEAGDSLSITVENAEVRKKEVSSFEEAKAFVESFSGIQSFSFDGKVVEVVLRE